MQIINFQNSFIQFCADFAEGCSIYNNVRLPIKYSSDVNFLLVIDDITEEEAGNIGFLWSNKQLAPDADIADEDIIANRNHLRTELAANKFLYAVHACYIPNAFSGSDYEPAIGDCIFLTMYNSDTDKVICQASLIFEYQTETCFTQVVRYRCEENAFEFNYEEINTYIESLEANTSGKFFNSIRLPITINSPVPIRTKNGFRDSAGAYRTLAANFEKEWKCSTDFMNDFLHTRLLIALEHDFLFLFEEPVSTGGSVTCENADYSDYAFYHDEADDYNIPWEFETPGINFGLSPASFKLKQDPFYAQNACC